MLITDNITIRKERFTINPQTLLVTLGLEFSCFSTVLRCWDVSDFPLKPSTDHLHAQSCSCTIHQGSWNFLFQNQLSHQNLRYAKIYSRISPQHCICKVLKQNINQICKYLILT